MTDSSRLVVTQGPKPGRTFPLDRSSLSLGRDPGNEIMIDHPQVSRQHARITRQAGRMVIEDLGSMNGTFVNGTRLTGSHALKSGDLIGLGLAASLTYRGADTPPAKILAGLSPGAPSPASRETPAATDQPAKWPAHPAIPSPVPTPTAPSPLAAPEADEENSQTWLWIGCGCLLVLLASVAATLFVWYAPASLWQALRNLGLPVPTWPF